MEGKFTDSNPVRYTPTFVGVSMAGEKIVLYRGIRDDIGYIRVDDGELWALSEGSKMSQRYDISTEKYTIMLESPQWTGTAQGTLRDIVEEDAIR